MREPNRNKGRPLADLLRTPVNAWPVARCKYCDKEYPRKKSWQKFCSLICKNAYWNIERILNEAPEHD